MGYSVIPLLIILELVKYLGFEDLLSTRFLSRNFNICVLKCLPSRIYSVSLHTQQKLTDFLNILPTAIHPVPFSRFILNPTIGTKEEIENLVQSYGEQMIEIYIDVKSLNKEFLPYCQVQYKEEVFYDERLLNYLSFLLCHANRVEVLQIDSDDMKKECDMCSCYMNCSTNLPLVPSLPNLRILKIPAYFDRFRQWVVKLIENAPALLYICHYEFDFEIYTGKFEKRIRRDQHKLMSCRIDYDEAAWFKECPRLRIKIIELGLIPKELIDRILVDQARNAIGIIGNDYVTELPITCNTVFPYVQEVKLSYQMWPSGMKNLTPANLPALRHVIVFGQKDPTVKNPFIGLVAYNTVTEFHIDNVGHDVKSPLWPWYLLFPKVKIFGVHSTQAAKYLEHFLPNFTELETICIQILGNNMPGLYGLRSILAGEMPEHVDFRGIKELVYTGVALSDRLLPSVLRSSQDGYLPNLQEISFKSDILEQLDRLKVRQLLRGFNSPIKVKWWVSNCEPGGGRQLTPLEIYCTDETRTTNQETCYRRHIHHHGIQIHRPLYLQFEKIVNPK